MIPPPDELADRLAIIDITHDYCWALDTKSWDALDEVFLADATADLGWPLEGRDAIKARIRAALEPLDESQHLVATHQVRLAGDEATCRCYLQAQHVKDGATFMFAGRYEDRFVRTTDGWRIAHRRIVRMWTAGDPTVMARGT